MDSKRQRNDRDSGISIDLGLGDLFRNMSSLVDLANEMAEMGQTEISREGDIPGLGKARGSYGFSMKVGMGGMPTVEPTVEPFGSAPQRGEDPVAVDVREPVVDIFDEGDRVLVVAEMPGAEEPSIEIQIEADLLSLSATGKSCKYAKEMLLPSVVKQTPARRSYRNGVLEIELEK